MEDYGKVYSMIKEFTKKLKKASNTRSRGYENVKVNENDLVYYQHQDKKAWLEPLCVFAIKVNDIFISTNGSVRKVPRCNVQICEREDEADEEKREEKQKGGSIKFDDQQFRDNITEEDIKKQERRITCSMMDVEKRELERDKVSTFWIKIENIEYFDDAAIYTVEVSVKEHKRPEVIEA